MRWRTIARPKPILKASHVARPSGPPAELPKTSKLRPSRTATQPVQRNRCPYCHVGIEVDQGGWVACRRCLARHHEACWRDTKACSCCLAREAVGDLSDRGRLPGSRPRRRAAPLLVLGLLSGMALSAGLFLVPWQLPESWRPRALVDLDRWISTTYAGRDRGSAPERARRPGSEVPGYVFERLDFLKEQSLPNSKIYLEELLELYPSSTVLKAEYRGVCRRLGQ